MPCVAHYGRAERRDHTVDTLQVDQPHEGVTRITLDRPERLNAMNAVLIAELHEALAGIAADRCLPGRRPDRCRPRLLRRDRPERLRRRTRIGAPRPRRGHIRHADRHCGARPSLAGIAAARDRRRERSGRGRRPRPGPGQRHPSGVRIGTLQRCLRASRSLRLRHRRELAVASAHRRVARLGADVDGTHH